jgi:hypothetical protein
VFADLLVGWTQPKQVTMRAVLIAVRISSFVQVFVLLTRFTVILEEHTSVGTVTSGEVVW